MTDKELIRKDMLSARRALSEDERKELSRIICERFLTCDEYKRADTILLYSSYNNEADTDMIFERAVADGKKVAYPVSKMTDGKPSMIFYTVDDLSKMRSGYMGIKEPDISDVSVILFEGPADICIAPGVAFDRKCNRIGYGKGFYDRYLRQNMAGLVIGLAFEIQMAHDLEPDEYDTPADMVITEKEIYVR